MKFSRRLWEPIWRHKEISQRFWDLEPGLRLLELNWKLLGLSIKFCRRL